MPALRATRPGLGQKLRVRQASKNKPAGRPPRQAAWPPRGSAQARLERPAGPVWRENLFLATTATQLDGGLSDAGYMEIQG